MASRPTKFLVCSNVKGRWKQLFTRIQEILTTKGTFDVLFAVGPFFPLQPDPQLEKEISDFISEKEKVPIPTYFLGNPDTGFQHSNKLDSHGKLCHNLFHLQNVSSKQISDLKLVSLSGVVSSLQTQNDKISQYSSTYSPFQCESFVQTAKIRECSDILLTNEIPTGFNNHIDISSIPPHFLTSTSSSGPSILSNAYSPRYIFFPGGNTYFARPAFRTEAGHVCRMIGIADFGTEGQKDVFAAATLTFSLMDQTKFMEQPPETTPNPFSRISQVIMTDPKVQPQYPHPHAMDEGKQKRGIRDNRQGRQNPRNQKVKPNEPDRGCWFCLGNPQFETGLLVAILTETFLAQPKGPLCPGHCLLLPIEHNTTYPFDSSLRGEINVVIDALTKMYNQQNWLNPTQTPKTVVVLEKVIPLKNTRAGHISIDVIPIDSSLEQVFLDAIKSTNPNIEFEEYDAQTTFVDEYSINPFYSVRVGKTGLIHKIQENERFPIQFGRQVLASTLGTPNRSEWRNCVLSKDDEDKTTNQFKKSFAPFSPEDDDD